MILTYHQFSIGSLDYCVKYYEKYLSKIELFKFEQDYQFLFFVSNYGITHYRDGDGVKKILYDTENKSFTMFMPWVKNKEEQNKQINTDLIIDLSNIPEFIQVNTNGNEKYYSNGHWILESKLLEYENKYNKLYDQIKNKIVDEFEQVKQSDKSFRYIIVRDIDGAGYDLDEKLSGTNDLDRKIEEFNSIHNLMTKYNYSSAVVQFDKIEFKENVYKINTTVSKCTNVLNKTVIDCWGHKENPDAKYEESGKLVQGQELLFEFYPWFKFDGFDNISSYRFSVYHRIADQDDSVMLFLMDEEQYQKELGLWANRYFYA
jgi:hypothetical protein